MIRYKIDVINELKNRGHTSYTVKRDKIFPESTMQKFRTGTLVSLKSLDNLCKILDCQPGDILEYVPDPDDIRTQQTL